MTMNKSKCIHQDIDSDDYDDIDKYSDDEEDNIVLERKHKPMIKHPECIIYDDGKYLTMKHNAFI